MIKDNAQINTDSAGLVTGENAPYLMAVSLAQILWSQGATHKSPSSFINSLTQKGKGVWLL